MTNILLVSPVHNIATCSNRVLCKNGTGDKDTGKIGMEKMTQVKMALVIKVQIKSRKKCHPDVQILQNPNSRTQPLNPNPKLNL